ncbi:hypothetical protein HNY73_000978 [Argiope bruennichi]|uniref:Uncharacterized protein n=1 Tax=Argiope bruennichi TaxID=94029 RepID=A0A8T0FZV2_ARGBR|nr:hypothetical protein HNY73_000978 [Argiope bruennichi]
MSTLVISSRISMSLASNGRGLCVKSGRLRGFYRSDTRFDGRGRSDTVYEHPLCTLLRFYPVWGPISGEPCS